MLFIFLILFCSLHSEKITPFDDSHFFLMKSAVDLPNPLICYMYCQDGVIHMSHVLDV